MLNLNLKILQFKNKHTFFLRVASSSVLPYHDFHTLCCLHCTAIKIVIYCDTLVRLMISLTTWVSKWRETEILMHGEWMLYNASVLRHDALYIAWIHLWSDSLLPWEILYATWRNVMQWDVGPNDDEREYCLMFWRKVIKPCMVGLITFLQREPERIQYYVPSWALPVHGYHMHILPSASRLVKCKNVKMDGRPGSIIKEVQLPSVWTSPWAILCAD